MIYTVICDAIIAGFIDMANFYFNIQEINCLLISCMSSLGCHCSNELQVYYNHTVSYKLYFCIFATLFLSKGFNPIAVVTIKV